MTRLADYRKWCLNGRSKGRDNLASVSSSPMKSVAQQRAVTPRSNELDLAYAAA